MHDKMKDALDVAGTVSTDTTLAAGEHWSRKIAAGDYLRIIDLEGKQAVDFLCFDAANPRENRYNAANTIKFGGGLYIGEGYQLYSELAVPLMTVVRDTCGHHDTIGGCCSTEANELRYGKKNTPNCKDNFTNALREHGLGPSEVVACVNFFMNFPVGADGSAAIGDGLSQPGDFVDLRAEIDTLVVISNCPQVDNPANGFNPTPIRLIEWSDER